MRLLGTLKYDFESNQWIVKLDDLRHHTLIGYGDTPQEAVDDLRRQANKHGLWPKEF